MREPTWWVNKFFAHPFRKRAEFLLERGRPEDLSKVLDWLSDAYEAALCYPPCAEVRSVEELREQLKRHGIPPTVTAWVGRAGPSGKDPGSLDLEEPFFWLDGFRDLALIFGDPERPAPLPAVGEVHLRGWAFGDGLSVYLA